jgi:hypothetical protein
MRESQGFFRENHRNIPGTTESTGDGCLLQFGALLGCFLTINIDLKPAQGGGRHAESREVQ